MRNPRNLALAQTVIGMSMFHLATRGRLVKLRPSSCPELDAKIAKAGERDGRLRGLKCELRRLKKLVNRGKATPETLARITSVENQIRNFPNA